MVLRGVGVSLDAAGIDAEKLLTFVLRSESPMGSGFGACPGSAEAHGGMTYCAVASLVLLGELSKPRHEALRRRLKRFCAMRAGTSFCDKSAGSVGFQGRPNKPCDTCYTFWIGASLAMLQVEWSEEAIDSVGRFVLLSQDDCTGGIGKETDAAADPLHTYFGLSGLAVLAHERMGLRPIEPHTGCRKKNEQEICL
jgi:geranylgeranyl transferase type-1 subunit beta